VNTDQNINSQIFKIGQRVKQSSRKRRKLIAVEIAETVNADQNINSQIFKIDQLVKQSSRKRRKLIAVEIAETVNIRHEYHLTHP